MCWWAITQWIIIQDKIAEIDWFQLSDGNMFVLYDAKLNIHKSLTVCIERHFVPWAASDGDILQAKESIQIRCQWNIVWWINKETKSLVVVM